MSWIWSNPSTKGLNFESPSKQNWHEGFDLEHCLGRPQAVYKSGPNKLLHNIPTKCIATQEYDSTLIHTQL
jgi:hypothetical protein